VEELLRDGDGEHPWEPRSRSTRSGLVPQPGTRVLLVPQPRQRVAYATEAFVLAPWAPRVRVSTRLRVRTCACAAKFFTKILTTS
jgi:hypothetical protein